MFREFHYYYLCYFVCLLNMSVSAGITGRSTYFEKLNVKNRYMNKNDIVIEHKNEQNRTHYIKFL